MIRLLLVDEHPIVRAGCERLLEREKDIVVIAQAFTVDEAWDLHLRHRPDLTITEVVMTGCSGLELLCRLRTESAPSRVLVFSMLESDILVSRTLELGAVGFLAKSCPPESLIDAVRAVTRGRRYLNPDKAPRLRGDSLERMALLSLTPKEFEVFVQLASGRSPSMCACDLRLSTKTIFNHQSVIKEKVGVSTSAGLTLLALRHGLLPLDSPC